MEYKEEVLYLSGYLKEDQHLLCPIESVIVLFITNYCQYKNLSCCLIEPSSSKAADANFCVPVSCLSHMKVLKQSPSDIQYCTLPAIQKTRMVRTGLCAVLRHIIKTIDEESCEKGIIKLLGFKSICLKSCAEVSVWTKFCEIEMPHLVKNLQHSERFLSSVPDEVLKLENHLAQPAIIPNISKRRKQAMKAKLQANTSDKSVFLRGADFEHVYAEGTDMTLTDLILFPCITSYLMTQMDSLHDLQQSVCRVLSWYRRLQGCGSVKQAAYSVGLPWLTLPTTDTTITSDHQPQRFPIKPHVDVRDPNKKKFKAHAMQVNHVLEKMEKVNIDGPEDHHPCGGDVKLAWDNMPPEVHPAQGELPGNRVNRKCEQLENLAKAVMHIARPGQVIVDFCSGGGHLGIVLAHLLPKCKIILVENKEESIVRAEQRIRSLKMSNIMLYQCNMNYFVGSYDIGVCLHACGVATDLVLQRCIDHRAAFVICPCCYGGIQNTHTLTYPRSSTFKDNVTYQEYLVLGHAADQTQVGIKQATDGKKCMLLIDTDRAESAREKGYHVTLCSLQPLSCSPKNDLLIGVLER